ncbi:MAG TPA: amidohydrolase family protein [Streptosporangiaceae bacterium]|jgi:predicted TIM-barrel fold metal-dependent hydrolase|nr:amidohydrolase family protein [Streptosporangiaceae bacterium]
MPEQTADAVPEVGTRIIDCHVHLCVDEKQERLVFPKKGWPLAWYWANPADAVPYMDARGISHMVTMNIMDVGKMTDARIARLEAEQGSPASAVAKEQIRADMRARIRRFNDWACGAHAKQERLLVFAMADPVLFGEDVVAEIERCLDLGATGVKLHPTFCRHLPDHPALLTLYDFCQDRGVPVLSDTNSREVPPGIGYGYPAHWRPVLKQFPRLRLIMAHLCAGMWDERVELAGEFKDNLWFDISGGFVDALHPSSGHRQLPHEQAPRVLKKIGIERILYGSDSPAFGEDVLDSVWQVLKLTLSDDEKEKILWRNSATLLAIE